MHIFEFLKEDHKKVNTLFEKIVSARSDNRRETLLQDVKQELLAHAHAEDAVFYETLAKEGDEEMQKRIAMARQEHEEVERMLMELERMRPGSDRWLIHFGMLKHAVEHHVQEEEGDIFAMAKTILERSQATELAEEMQTVKEEELEQVAA